MADDIFIAWPGYENALEEELSDTEYKTLTPQSIQIPHSGVKALPAFARQFLPRALVIKDQSIKQHALAIVDCIPRAGSWKLHLCDARCLDNFEVGGRDKLIQSTVEELLKKSDRFALKRWVGEEDKVETLIQHFTLSSGLSSISVTKDFYPNGLVIEPGIGGRVFIKENRSPPSRAYRKLQEAFLLTGLRIKPGDTIVDLGSSPGGWTWVCVESGAKVIAVDRTDLNHDLMRNPLVKFVKGDAFSFKPKQQVDWLISDIIATPDKIIKLLQTWLNEGRMKKFCVTLKFKGESRKPYIDSLREMLGGTSCLIRHLENNKNEITAVGVIDAE